LRREAIKPEMNVTPLVDVVLVLLIIFMVITPQLEGGPAIDVPGIFHPDPKVGLKSEPVTVGLTTSGETVLDKVPTERTALLDTLRTIHTTDPDKRVILKADRAARYGDVRALFKDIREIGFAGVSLQVGDKKSPAPDAAAASVTAAPSGSLGR